MDKKTIEEKKGDITYWQKVDRDKRIAEIKTKFISPKHITMKPSTAKNLAPYRSNHKTVKTMTMKVRQLIVEEVLTVEDFGGMDGETTRLLIFPLGRDGDFTKVYHNVKKTHPVK